MKPIQKSQPKQRVVHFVFQNPKYLKDKNFLKPCKLKRRKRAKKPRQASQPTGYNRMHPNEYSQRVHAQRLNQFTQQERIGSSTPSWAKLARARSIPNR
jgi:hypothetical protein